MLYMLASMKFLPKMKTLECLLTQVMSKKGVLQVPKVGYAPGELAQMVERPLRMREVPGSIPGFSKTKIFCNNNNNFFTLFFVFCSFLSSFICS